MKILHTSDWHLGHTLYNYDRKEEQQDMLSQIVEIATKERPDAFLLSGDVYDITQPSASAQELFSNAMAKLRQAVPDMTIVVTAGNHDGGSRTEAFHSLLSMVDIHTIGTLDKEHPDNHIIELPGKGFIIAMPYAPERSIPEGFQVLLGDLVAERNTEGLPVVMMAHTTVKNADYRGHNTNNEHIIGGIEGVEISTFGDGYDYLALGHIHRPQTFHAKDNRLLRYSGTPLAISFDEDYREPSDSTDSEKREHGHSVSIVEIGHRGEPPQVSTIEIKNIHPLVTLPTGGPLPWEDVKQIFDNYPSTLPTYIRLNVAIEDTLPSQAYTEALEIAKKKSCRYCLINAVRTETTQQGTTHRTMELSEFQQMNPIDILKQFYRDKKGIELPEDLEKMFNEAVNDLYIDLRL